MYVCKRVDFTKYISVRHCRTTVKIYSHWKNISSNHLFRNFTKFLPNRDILSHKDTLWNQFTLCNMHVEKYYKPRSTMWKLLRLVSHFWKKFRESNVFTKEIAKEIIWRNIFMVRLNFSFFHTFNGKMNIFSVKSTFY